MDNYSSYCTDCKTQSEIVYDHASGDTICGDCGLVLEEHFIDETSEWRSFASDNAADDRDPSRIGHASDPFLSKSHLTTTISKPLLDSSSSSSSLKWKIDDSSPDQTLIRGFEAIAIMSDRLVLVSTVRDRAKEIYKKVEEHKTTIKGRKNQDAILAACLYIACAEEHKPRTLKEICSVANGATQKEIYTAKKRIDKQFKQDMDMNMDAPAPAPAQTSVVVGGGVHAAEFVTRYCSNLNLKFQTIKAAQEAVKNSGEFDIRRNPTSVVAAVIYMITQLSPNDKRFLKDISAATGVAESTIRNAYRDIYPYASMLLPSSYTQGKDLKILLTAP